jgi:hypothetical protein
MKPRVLIKSMHPLFNRERTKKWDGWYSRRRDGKIHGKFIASRFALFGPICF